MDIKKLVVDVDKANQGVRVEYDSETVFTLASVNSKKYREAYQKALTELRRRTRNPSTEDSDAAVIKCYADAIILDWSGLTSDGNPFPCTPENALWLLTNCPSVRDFIFLSANDNELFRREVTEAAKAALGESSSGV